MADHGKPALRRAWGRAALAVWATLLAGPAAHAADLPRPPAPDANLDQRARFAAMGTPAALDARAVEAAFAPVRAEARGLRVLVVPAYLTDALLPLRAVGLVGFFDEQERWLQGEGIAVARAPIVSAAAVRENARHVAAAVRASDRPVCLLTHSKGGLDALAFLVAADEAALAKVRCWVALQAPFWGSPIADLAADSALVGLASQPLLAIMGGSRESYMNLRVAERQEAMRRDAPGIARVARQVSILSVASWIDVTEGSWFVPSPYAATRRLMESAGLRNDGLVPTDSSVLPGTRYVVLPNVEHAEVAIVPPLRSGSADRVPLTKLLLALALERP
ncbi:MAG: hypothetical protein JNK11_15610 [Alphaproteobacteria bacterium]|nr:hypothetical protein [Alphaproteobacteria bacterium]